MTASGAPTTDKDPYSTKFLIDPYPFHPYPFHEELRKAGPVVWLEAYDVWAVGCHEHVRNVLTDWRTFMSGVGVGLINLRVDVWRPPSLLLEADPPDHTAVRQIIERVLSPRAVKILRGVPGAGGGPGGRSRPAPSTPRKISPGCSPSRRSPTRVRSPRSRQGCSSARFSRPAWTLR